MSEFNALLLDVNKIEGAIRGFPGVKSINGPTSTLDGRGQTYEIEHQDGAVALLMVYLRGDGRTTLQYKVGKNQALSLSIAEHVRQTAAKIQFDPKPLALKFISKEDWDYLREALAADGLTLSAEALAHGERYKVTSSGTDCVYVHRYNTGKFLMQGRPHNAYSKVVDCLSYISSEKKELIDAQLATVEITSIDSTGLLRELEQRLPSACKRMDETLKFILAPALAVQKISIDLPDYSLVAFPALRGLEGCIKHLFASRGYSLGTKLNIGDQFDSNRNLKPSVQAALSCTATSASIELLYANFSKHRNSLMHVDSFVPMTRIIEKQSEAIGIVDSALYVIEKAYSNIP